MSSTLKTSQNGNQFTKKTDLSLRKDRIGTGLAKVKYISFSNMQGEIIDTAISGENLDVILDVDGKKLKNLHNLKVYIGVNNLNGERLFTISNTYTGEN